MRGMGADICKQGVGDQEELGKFQVPSDTTID